MNMGGMGTGMMKYFMSSNNVLPAQLPVDLALRLGGRGSDWGTSLLPVQTEGVTMRKCLLFLLAGGLSLAVAVGICHAKSVTTASE